MTTDRELTVKERIRLLAEIEEVREEFAEMRTLLEFLAKASGVELPEAQQPLPRVRLDPGLR